MQTKGIQGAVLLSGAMMSQPGGASLDMLPGIVSKDNMVYTTEQMVPVGRYQIPTAMDTSNINQPSSSPVYFQRFIKDNRSTNSESIQRATPIARKIKSEPSQDDDQKLYLRRKRNREAAARCRQRRLDLIGSLSEQVKKLDAEKHQLEAQLKQTQQERAELLQTLKAHAATCDLADKAFMKPLMDEVLPSITDCADQTVPAYSTPPPQPAVAVSSSSPPSSISGGALPSISNAYPINASSFQGVSFSPNMVLLVNDAKSGVIKSASFVPYSGASSESSPAQHQTIVPSRPNTLEIMAPSTNLPLETPSSGTFTFDPKITALLNESTGLTPTLGTGLTPIVPNTIAPISINLETPTITATSFVSL